MTTTDLDMDLLRHATAWPECYRNYYAAEPNGHDAQRWEVMVSAGLATRGRMINQPPHQLRCYHVSKQGTQALHDDERRNPPRDRKGRVLRSYDVSVAWDGEACVQQVRAGSRGAARYAIWLQAADAIDLSFAEFNRVHVRGVRLSRAMDTA